ncbi:hypothetical protein C2845_PM03G33180 [Panicum miliaceum]|uniref:Uncharacterized protein n=1 Tax=Panicum miliaceum TaxID=4540 RepID=A0A3L6TDT3_PANMI|nr:hypothetical protein C2845_PM03G33180 [Panicum miliaceum]
MNGGPGDVPCLVRATGWSPFGQLYREVGAALHAMPAGLGTLTLCRSIVQAACYPLAAYAAARHNRAHIIAVGASGPQPHSSSASPTPFCT